jgi:hypothetical protein
MDSLGAQVSFFHRIPVMPRLLLASVVLVFLASLKSTAVRGDEIPIVNHGFEDQVVVEGDFIRGPLAGWSNSGDSGVFNPATTSLPGQASEGVNVAFIGGSFAGGPISQTLSTVLTVGSYELRIDVGDRLDTSFAGYSVGLLAGGALLAQDNNSLTPSNGTFVTSLTTFTVIASEANLGQTLTISISVPNSTTGFQTVFDNVRLARNAASSSADFDQDGDVDGDDLIQWQGDYRLNGESDADGDGDSDGRDFMAWQRQFTEPGALAVNSTAVPEPSAMVLVLLGCYSLSRKRRFS